MLGESADDRIWLTVPKTVFGLRSRTRFKGLRIQPHPGKSWRMTHAVTTFFLDEPMAGLIVRNSRTTTSSPSEPGLVGSQLLGRIQLGNPDSCSPGCSCRVGHFVAKCLAAQLNEELQVVE